MPHLKLFSCCEDDTLAIGRQIGASVSNGAFIALTGDHHSGKTMLVRGIACGLDVPAWAALRSPARTLMLTYHGGRHVLHHVDFYHLNQAPELPERIESALSDSDAVSVVEWADVMPELWPEFNLIEIHVHEGQGGKRIDVIHEGEHLCPDLALGLVRWMPATPMPVSDGVLTPVREEQPVADERRRPKDDRRRQSNIADIIYGDRRRSERRRQA